jgi:acylphosphatase
MAKERRIILFSGSVQGVGFRYTACRSAAGFDVTGAVRNLHDGRVECVVEGEAAEIDAFLADLRERMSGYIDNLSQQTLPPTGQFSRFGVAF